jgi:hypothetical protein
VRGNFELGCEHLRHAIEIAENLIVPDANDSVAKGSKVSVAAPIGFAIGVLTAVDLDDETLLAAHEVGVTRSKRLLAREFQPSETAITKSQPQHPLGSRASSS